MRLGAFLCLSTARETRNTLQRTRDIARHRETSRDIARRCETSRDVARHRETSRDIARHRETLRDVARRRETWCAKRPTPTIKKFWGARRCETFVRHFYSSAKTRASLGIPRRDNARRYQVTSTENFLSEAKKFFQPHLIAIDFVSPRKPAPALGFRARRKMSHKCLATSQNQFLLSYALLGIPRQPRDSAIFDCFARRKIHKNSL